MSGKYSKTQADRARSSPNKWKTANKPGFYARSAMPRNRELEDVVLEGTRKSGSTKTTGQAIPSFTERLLKRHVNGMGKRGVLGGHAERRIRVIANHSRAGGANRTDAKFTDELGKRGLRGLSDSKRPGRESMIAFVRGGGPSVKARHRDTNAKAK